MVKRWINKGVKWYCQNRYRRMQRFMTYPAAVQNKWWKKLKVQGQHTEWGRMYGFQKIRNLDQWRKQVPIQTYEDVKPFIQRMMLGEPDILWPGKIKWFSKSSGTSGDQSKYIPVSNQNFRLCHIGGSWDSCAIHYQHRPDAKLFESKALVMGGSATPYEHNPKALVGDVSGLMTKHMPAVGKIFYTPDFEIALLTDWEEKIERMARQVIHEPVYMFGGVPTWIIVLFDRMLALTGKAHISDIWPEVGVYMHGGVGFSPYKEQFEKYIPKSDFLYQEIYNASEGFFAVQNEWSEKDLLLLLDNGIFFEFIPKSEWQTNNPLAIGIEDLEVGEIYSLVISTNSGLWRYLVGDTIQVTSTRPLKITISGRTSQFINVFGEEVMIHNTDRALALTCHEQNALVTEYTVAPIFLRSNQRGAHEWIIEFDRAPADIQRFASSLDRNLQNLNSDYQAKRTKNIALQNLKIQSVPKGTFIRWMQERGKLGGQHKVPRLSNDRKYVDSILSLIGN